MQQSSRRRWASALAAAALAVVPAVATASPPASAAGGRSEWIVVLDDAAPGRAADVARDHTARYGVDVSFTYSHALHGYAASVPDARVDQLRRDPAVASLERSTMVRAARTQTGAPWGLDRIDQQTGLLSGTYRYNRTGAGVTVYVVDTGMQFSHPEFGGRAVSGFDAVDGGAAEDCNGHGTHVAGTVGATTYGVAKKARLVGVRVLDCTAYGSTAQVVAGIDWIVADHAAGTPAVANLSLTGWENDTIDAAVARGIADGVSFVVAAGNENHNACRYSPARAPDAITVAASDAADAPASFTNRGRCVDWYAPGVNILSTWPGSGTATSSGTSMAAPHTSGVAALYLQGNPTASPARARSVLFNRTTKDVVPDTDTPNNHLLYTRF